MTTTTIEKTVIETIEGKLFFEIVEVWNDQEDKLWRNFYIVNDTRTETNREYKTEKGYRAAIKRYSKL